MEEIPVGDTRPVSVNVAKVSKPLAPRVSVGNGASFAVQSATVKHIGAGDAAGVGEGANATELRRTRR